MKKAADIINELVETDWTVGEIDYPFSLIASILNCGFREKGCEENCRYYNAGLETIRKKIEVRTNKEQKDSRMGKEDGCSSTTFETPCRIECRLYKPNREDICYIEIFCKKVGLFTPEDIKEFNVSTGKLGNSVLKEIDRIYRKDKQQ